MSERPKLTDAQRSELCVLAGRLSGMGIALRNGWADPQLAGRECEAAYKQLIRFVQGLDLDAETRPPIEKAMWSK